MKPALIISSHTNGLGVIRALGIEGVPIVVLYYQQNDMGYVSKYVDEAIRVPHPENQEEDFILEVVRCLEKYPDSLVIPADDASLVAVSRNKNRLEAHGKIVSPDWNMVEQLIEKRLTYQIAQKNNIPIPNTLFPASIEDIEKWEPEINYPCIVKPSQSHRYYCVFQKKMALVKNYDELISEYRKAADKGLEVMLQEFIPGDERCNVNYCSYFWDGEALVEFTAEKIRQAPPLLGVPTVLRSKHLPDIHALGRRTLKAFGFYGYACVEFKKDERDGIYKLLDFNGRLNLSILHSVRCGINFPLLTYRHMTENILPSKRIFIEDIYWINMTKDLISGFKSSKGKRIFERDTWVPYFSKKIFAIFDLNDIRPFIKRCENFLKPKLKSKTLDQFLGSGGRSNKNKTIYIEGDACNRRLLEKSKIMRYLEMNGYELRRNPEDADYILLVTCAFKKKEEDRSVSRLKSLIKHKSELLVYGCLPEISPGVYSEFSDIKNLAPKDLAKIDTFFDDIKIKYSEIPDDNIIDHYSNKGLLSSLYEKTLSNGLFTEDFFFRVKTSAIKHLKNTLVKSSRDFFLFICSGCLGKCSYCAIRRSIGSVKSKPTENILEEFREGIRKGYHNISMLGDDPGCYGLDNGSTFADLLSSLLDECRNHSNNMITHGNDSNRINIHIKEIHPKHLLLYKEKIYKLYEDKHIKSMLCPIQSGNNRILELMRREHTVEEIHDVIRGIRNVNPEIELTTQIIVGFPSETENEFRETLDFVEKSGFDSVVVFPYHDKENTPASRLEGKIAEDQVQLRARTALKHFRKNGIKAYSKCPS